MSHLAASELWQQSVQQLKEMMKLVQAGEKPLNVEGVFKIVFFYCRLSYYTCTHMEKRMKTHGKKQNYEFSGLNISYP